MSQLTIPAGPQTGLGYAQIISAILGPLVQGGASIYGTASQEKIASKQLRERRKEQQRAIKLAQDQLEAQERAQYRAQVAAIQQAQIARARSGQTAPFAVVAVGIGVLGLVAITALRKK